MSRIIELPDELYQDLEKVAQDRGLTPAGWIAATLPCRSGSSKDQLLSDLLHGLIGAIDSTTEPPLGHARTPFGELISKKFKRQGLRIP
jgi:hypothetical protein